MKTQFTALVKQSTSKALVSGDKSYRALLETHDARMNDLTQAPANAHVKVIVEWEEK